MTQWSGLVWHEGVREQGRVYIAELDNKQRLSISPCFYWEGEIQRGMMSGDKKGQKKKCPEVKVKGESDKVKDTCMRPVAWCGLRKAQILVYSWI